jgi:hypothetical protein
MTAVVPERQRAVSCKNAKFVLVGLAGTDYNVF